MVRTVRYFNVGAKTFVLRIKNVKYFKASDSIFQLMVRTVKNFKVRLELSSLWAEMFQVTSLSYEGLNLARYS